MAEHREIVYLVDGSSYIHRAYHAVRALANSQGLPTNAAFGFTKMILKLLEEKAPAYLAVVFDAKGPTFRHAMYEAYKATRPPLQEDLVVQLPYIKKIVKGLNIRMIEKPGYEADDVIGTLARKCEESDFDVVIVSGDKDFRQTISPSTSMWDSMKDRITNYESFKRDYGIEPAQMKDLMGLSGDPSDNIPGVAGVGEKTALKLVRQYGSLENVYDCLQEINQKKLKENLETSRDDALLSKKLVTIDRHVPLDESIDDLRVGKPNGDMLTAVFRELEFKGLWEQFADRREVSSSAYRLCLTGADLRSLVQEIKKGGVVSIDTETTSQDPLRADLVGISLSFEEGGGYYLPVAHQYPGVPKQLTLRESLAALKEILEDGTIKKVGQNIKYDALVLRGCGIELKGIYFDTMVASYVINPGLRQHNLDSLAQHYLNHKMISYHEIVGKGKKEISFGEVPVEKAMVYSCEDAEITMRLMSLLDDRLRENENLDLFHGLEMKLLPVLIDMEWEGIKIDEGIFRRMSRDLKEKIQGIRASIYEEAGMEFNINSSQQLGFILFEKLGLPVQKKTFKTRAYSTDVRVLKKLAASNFRIPELVLRYRTLSKLKSTYLDALVKMVHPKTGRIHTSFNQTVTATGRLSSSDPNLQNIPVRGDEGRAIRQGFVADEGHVLLSADYSQVELRVFAHYSEDEAFIDAFRKEQDIHALTASEILGVEPGDVTPDMRRIAKAINFGIIYGMGPKKLSEEVGIDTKTAKKYIETYYGRYGGVARYREQTVKFARKKGYVTTLFNRRRYLTEINHGQQRIRAEGERMAINTPIQGTAADLIKKAMINIHNRLREDRLASKMILQVHDELLFQVPEKEIDRMKLLVKKEMEDVHELAVPLKVDMGVGRNWDEAH